MLQVIPVDASPPAAPATAPSPATPPVAAPAPHAPVMFQSGNNITVRRLFFSKLPSETTAFSFFF